MRRAHDARDIVFARSRLDFPLASTSALLQSRRQPAGVTARDSRLPETSFKKSRARRPEGRCGQGVQGADASHESSLSFSRRSARSDGGPSLSSSKPRRELPVLTVQGRFKMRRSLARSFPSSLLKLPTRIGRGALPMLALLLLASLASSTTVTSARTRPIRREKLQPQVTCPLPDNYAWKFLGDLNYPDGTPVPAGTTFDKKWRLQNCGQATWADFTAHRVSGDFGPVDIPLANIAPMETLDVTARMTAPSTLGTQRATYRIQIAPGVYLADSFWVEIDVTAGGTFTLSVGTAGSGTVTSTPAGISCPSACSASFASGTTVALAPNPDPGFLFGSWSGDPDCSDGVVQMNTDRSCTATFVPNTGTTYTLTVSRTGSGSGTVTGPGIYCGPDCTEIFASGTPVPLNAIPDAGSGFDGWSGDPDCLDGSVTMDGDRQCTASFSPLPPGAGLQLSASPSEVTLNGQGWPSNNPVTVSVTASCPGFCAGNLVLNIGESGGAGRFYLYESNVGGNCTLTDDDPGDRFSARAAVLNCSIVFSSPDSKSYQLKLWMQPSEGGTMPVEATWQGQRETASVRVPAAAVHPVVFIHGILGSMPPWDVLVTNRVGARTFFDPFLGHYWPILDTLLKMGYEWNRTLFGIAYDWRAPNEKSADFLRKKLAKDIIPSSSAVPYVAGDGRADLLVHSMGGLVARSYIQGPDWANNVRKVIFAASPHRGFPFDYRTWEGMTWSDYVYAAPPLPPVGGATFTMVMDRILWPTLIAKRYRPSSLDTFLCTNLGSVASGPLLALIVTGSHALVVVPGDPLPSVLACPVDLVEGWAKSGDASRGIGSLRQMLPTEDSPPYIFSAVDGSAYPQGHEVNTFLRDLNANIGLLVSRIGVGNIYVLAGDGAPVTDRRYRAWPHVLGNLWTYGSVPAFWPYVEEWTSGDDLIPTTSSTLNSSGLVGLPPGNEKILDAGPPNGARHSPLMHLDEVQRTWVPKFLADLEPGLPFSTDYVVPDLISSQVPEIVAISLLCPANVMVTDPLGRRLGYDPVTKTVVNEIPHSTYLSPDVEPQLLWVGDPKPGRYEVRTTGWLDVGADPTYAVRADRVGVGGTVGPIIAVAGVTAPLQEDTFEFDLVPNRPPMAEAGPAQTVAAGPDCTASVVLDGSGSSDPDGDTLYYEWETDFGTTYGGVQPTLSLPLGVHTITLTVNDGKGQLSRASVVITVEDRTPPTITVPARITAEQTSRAGTPVSLPDPVVKDNCSLPSVRNDAPAVFPLGATLVTYTAIDAAGNVATATTTVVVQDTTPPVLANIPAPVKVEQQGRDGTRVTLGLPTATDICDAAPVVTSDAPAIFPLGVTTVTFTAVDASGNVARAHTTVTVVDTTPPVIQKLAASPSSLWPPNHQMVQVAVAATALDICDAKPRCRIASVASSEPVTGKGDNTTPDWHVTGDLSLDLRSERTGGGSGRTYTITVACADASGNAATGTVAVSVPHDQGGGR
jgi:pimeloyl-ACP methyl ester carboxylesterase